MRRLLMDPAFPDIVGEWATNETGEQASSSAGSANDNETDLEDLSDPLLSLVARAEIEATRLW